MLVPEQPRRAAGVRVRRADGREEDAEEDQAAAVQPQPVQGVLKRPP